MGDMIDPIPVQKEIEKRIAQLFDLNQKISRVLRTQAKDFEQLAVTYSHLSRRCYEIVELIAELAVISASNTGDIIMAEFGLEEVATEEEVNDEEDDGQGIDGSDS